MLFMLGIGLTFKPRPGHHVAGALACRICVLFHSPYRDLGQEAVWAAAALVTVVPANAGPVQVFAGQLSQ